MGFCGPQGDEGLRSVRAFLRNVPPKAKILTVQTEMVKQYAAEFPGGYQFEWDSATRCLTMREPSVEGN